MKKLCPLMAIASWVAEITGHNGEMGYCEGPECQWWPKCRRKSQCPVCGKEGKPDEKYSNRLSCPAHGYFYTDD